MTVKYVFNPTTGNIDATDKVAFNGEVTLGSAASPSIFFTGDPNTGIYSPGADQLALSTGGSERLRITSAGLVGIGTGAPAYGLEVNNQDIAITNRPSTGTGNPVLYLRRNVESGDANTVSTHGTLAFQTDYGINGTFVTSSSILAGSPGDNNNTYFAFSTTNSGGTFGERMRLTSTGLGIGDNGPDSTLTIKAAAATTPLKVSGPTSEFLRCDQQGRLLVGTASARSSDGVTPRYFQEGSLYEAFGICANGGTTPNSGAFIFLSRSRGTTLGSSTIVAAGDTLGSINFYGADGTDINTAAAYIAAQVDGTPGTDDMPGRLVFSTTADGASSPTERMRITSTGQLRLAGAGITFNGDTATANELDDYEEGTWTPTFVPQTGSFASIAYDSTRAGQYTKIGNCVTVWGVIRTDSVDTTGASGVLAIGGLPFSVGTGTQGGGFATSLLNWAGEDPSAVRPVAGETFAYLSYRTAIDGADTISDVSDLTTGTADANRVSFQFSYRV